MNWHNKHPCEWPQHLTTTIINIIKGLIQDYRKLKESELPHMRYKSIWQNQEAPIQTRLFISMRSPLWLLADAIMFQIIKL